MTITSKVESILSRSHDARNSDKALWIIYAQEFGLQLTSEQIEIVKDMPSFESLRRVRQKLNELGKYPADPKVAKERDFKSMRMQQITPDAKPEYIDRVINVNVPKAIPWMEDEKK